MRRLNCCGILPSKQTVKIHHRRPDIVIQKKKAKETIIVDIAVPGDNNVLQKETEKYLAREIKRIWKSRTKVAPVVVGALGSVSKKLAGHLEQLGIQNRTRTMQKSGTPRIGTYPQKK